MPLVVYTTSCKLHSHAVFGDTTSPLGLYQTLVVYRLIRQVKASFYSSGVLTYDISIHVISLYLVCSGLSYSCELNSRMRSTSSYTWSCSRTFYRSITKHGSTWYIGMAHVPRHRFHTFEKSQYHFHFQQNLPLSPPPSSHCRYACLPEVQLNLHK